MNHAIVIDGIVVNVIWLVPGTPFPDAVRCGDLPVAIGDTYTEGVFYRNGHRVLTPLEEVEEAHDAEMAALIEEVYQEDLIEIFGEDE